MSVSMPHNKVTIALVIERAGVLLNLSQAFPYKTGLAA
jgi:hypothetical protein